MFWSIDIARSLQWYLLSGKSTETFIDNMGRDREVDIELFDYTLAARPKKCLGMNQN